MKQGRWTAIAAIGLGCLVPGGTAMAAMGDLDPSFSGDGKLVYAVTDNGRADEIVVDTQQRILAGGNVNPPGADANDFAVARFTPAGAPDPSFSGDGFVAIPVGAANSNNDGNALAIDAAGRVYIAGGSGGGNGDFAVARLTDSGALDPSYGGGDGIATLDTGDNGDVVVDIALDGAGRVVIGGVSNDDFAVARFTTAGFPDSSFGGGDAWERQNVNSIASEDRGTGVAVDSAGRIVLGGYTALAAGQENFAVMRFTPAGLLDTSFSNDIPTPGRTIQLMASESGTDERDFALGLALASGDRPVAVGEAERTGLGDEFAFLRLDATGQPDASFSGDGKAYAGFGATFETARAVTIDSAGRIVFAGDTEPLVGDGAFAAGRLLPSGALDPSFGGDGLTNADIGTGSDTGQAVAIERSGRIVVAGYNGAFITGDWALARFEGVPRCGGRIPTLTGTPGNDKLKGTKGVDVISGGDGKDVIIGAGKKDFLCGEGGKDTLKGGKGNDKLFGGAGKDKLLGGKGKDKLVGGKGNDRLVGGPGKDKLKGGKGKDKEKQ